MPLWVHTNFFKVSSNTFSLDTYSYNSLSYWQYLATRFSKGSKAHTVTVGFIMFSAQAATFLTFLGQKQLNSEIFPKEATRQPKPITNPI